MQTIMPCICDKIKAAKFGVHRGTPTRRCHEFIRSVPLFLIEGCTQYTTVAAVETFTAPVKVVCDSGFLMET